MKAIKILSIAFTLFYATQSQAQLIVNGINLNNKEDIKVIDMIVYGNIFKQEVQIRVDYGQEIKLAFDQSSLITTKDGNRVSFKSKVDAINYLELNGWRLFEVDSIGGDDSISSTNYYFRKLE